MGILIHTHVCVYNSYSVYRVIRVAVQKGVGCLDLLLGRDRCLMMMKALVNSTVQTVEAVKLSVFHNLAEYEPFPYSGLNARAHSSAMTLWTAHLLPSKFLMEKNCGEMSPGRDLAIHKSSRLSMKRGYVLLS